MGEHVTTFKYPGRMSSSRFAQNGCTPHSGAWRKLAEGTNFASLRLRKCMASYGTIPAFTPAGASGNKRHWYFPFRSGVNVSQIDFWMAVAPYDNASATDPRARVGLYDVSGATYTYSGYFRNKKFQTGTYGWADSIWVAGSIAVPAEETFYVLFTDCEDYGRVQSFTAFERAFNLADDTKNGVCNPTVFEEHGQILDSHVQDVLTAQTKIWQANARHLAGWTQRSDSNSFTVNSTTWTNPFDGSTAVSANTVGFTLLTQYNDTRSGTVPCEIATSGSRSAGTGNLEIRYQSASGTLCSATNTGGGTFWQALSTSFAANSAETKYDLQMRCSDGSTTFTSVRAGGLWEYEA